MGGWFKVGMGFRKIKGGSLPRGKTSVSHMPLGLRMSLVLPRSGQNMAVVFFTENRGAHRSRTVPLSRRHRWEMLGRRRSPYLYLDSRDSLS